MSANIPAEIAERLSDHRTEPVLPDFAQKEYARQVVCDDLVPAVTEIISLLQAGKHASHDALLRAAAMLERALLKKWNEL